MNEKAVKWLVIGVIALVCIIIFRDEIKRLVGRTNISEIEISKGKLRVVATPIGATTVSVQSLPEKSYIGIEQSVPNVYIDKEYKFMISWPLNSEWVPSNRMSQSELEMAGIKDRSAMPTFFVAKWRKTSLSPHIGMVSVDVYPSEQYGKNVQVLANEIYKSMALNSITLISSTIDQNTGGAVLVTRDERSGMSSVSRLLVGDTYAYNIFSSTYSPSEEYAKLRDETNFIFNSIRILQ